MNDVVGAFDCVDFFLVCRGCALASLAIGCLYEKVSMFVSACVTELESSEVANVVNEAIQEMKLDCA